ncbi:MAG TPA: hypothetical protein VGQ40_08735 [Chthoniobacterales bacterium]|nr:hypothetical protein [Chthoniobacterales bacterium]
MNDQDAKVRTPKEDAKLTEKKERKFELRDLKPTKEVKGGAAKPKTGEKGGPDRTVEVDFMGWD